VGLIGTAFAVGGVWLGWRLSARPTTGAFARNAAAQASLGLTGQEMKVLERLAAGQSNKEIARSLGLLESTVKVHVKTILKKLPASNRTQAAMLALELGLARRPGN